MVFKVLLLLSICQTAFGIQNRFVTQLCPGSMGPTHGEVIRFDPNYNTTTWVIPDADIDCWLTLRGMPTTDGPQWFTVLEWVDSFTVRGYDYAATGCSTGFLEIYQASAEGQPVGAAIQGPLCGDIPPTTISTTDQSIVLRLYAEKNPAATTTTTTTNTTTTTTTNTTSSTNGTTLSYTGSGPWIAFRADFTSYFQDCAADGTANDNTQMQCTSGRCVDTSLTCDSYGADNCGDLSDQSSGLPANCTEVPPEEDNLVEDLIPLFVIIGILFLLSLYWCWWRPGYIPWRLGRCRNCCHAICRPCRKAGCCNNGCCGKATGCCACNATNRCCTTRSGYPYRDPDDIDINDANKQDLWHYYANDDGMHVREGR